MTGLAQKVEALHRSLEDARIPHAFGGALALAFCVGEPRATADIDLNVFVAPARAPDVFAALPKGVSAGRELVARARDQGQVRIPWDETPIDMFFAYHQFHEQVAARTRVVPFGTITIPVLECGDLVVFKAIFGRPQDWVDIQNVIEAGEADLADPLERLETLLGHDDPAYRRLAAIRSEPGDEAEPYRRAFGTPSDQDE